MKIERISENQIRCTLYKADLADKELLLTELAYGTDKAKELFRELMQQASNELGFEVDNIPLMIEAIPVSKDCLVLIITKVEDPEELDTRFSRFTKPIVDRDYDEDDDMDLEDDSDYEESVSEQKETADKEKSNVANGFIEALGSLAEGLGALGVLGAAQRKESIKSAKDNSDKQREIFRMYAFKNLDDVILSAKLIKNVYASSNSLYKNPVDSHFYLYMTKDNNTDVDFIRSCNVVSEYGNKVKTTYATTAYIKEHYNLIIDSNAVQTLSEL